MKLTAFVVKSSLIRPSRPIPFSQPWRQCTLHVISREDFHQGPRLDMCTPSLAIVGDVQ